MEGRRLVYIDKDDGKGSDALFWAAYLVADDSTVAPLVLTSAIEAKTAQLVKDLPNGNK